MVVKSKYLTFNYDETKGFFLCISISQYIWVTLFLPFAAFVFCVTWSIIYHFEETTYTHCKVWNLLPSISSAIGTHTTEFFVWSTAVTIHSVPRYMFIGVYYRYFEKCLKIQKKYLAKIAVILNVVEITGLIGLSYLSSSHFYAIHEKCFITFMFASESYMLVTCMMLRYCRRNTVMDKYEAFSLRMKTRLFIINAISFTMAGYFFLRHNRYCEPGIYTMFAVFEYIVVLSNMAFHLTALIDFRDQYVTIYSNGIDVR